MLQTKGNWQYSLRYALDPAHIMNNDIPQGEVVCKACGVLGIVPDMIVEIGVYKGYSSCYFLDYFPDAELFLVDPWIAQNLNARMYRRNGPADWEEIYNDVIKEFGSKATIMRMTSEEAEDKFLPASLDVVFIDGDHSYRSVCRDIELWLPKMRKGGLFCGHDYSLCGANAGVVKAVNEMIGGENVVIGSRKTWLYYVE